MLKGIRVVRVGYIKQRANLTFLDHVVVIGATGAGPSRLSGRVLNQLADPFFQGHLVEEGIYFLIKDGIVETGVEWCATGRHSSRVLLRSGRLAKHQEAGNGCESNERGEHVFLNSDRAVN
jgi:hypothetical protein